MSPSGVVQRKGPLGDRGTGMGEGGRSAASLGSRVSALLLTLALALGTLGVGWMAWTVLEWRQGRTAAFRLTGLRVVRRSNGRPIGLGRAIVRNAILCTILLVPTIAACLLVGLAFVMGASPPNGLLRQPRTALWDRITDTEVIYEGATTSELSDRTLGRIRPEDAEVSMN